MQPWTENLQYCTVAARQNGADGVSYSFCSLHPVHSATHSLGKEAHAGVRSTAQASRPSTSIASVLSGAAQPQALTLLPPRIRFQPRLPIPRGTDAAGAGSRNTAQSANPHYHSTTLPCRFRVGHVCKGSQPAACSSHARHQYELSQIRSSVQVMSPTCRHNRARALCLSRPPWLGLIPKTFHPLRRLPQTTRAATWWLLSTYHS